MDVEEWRTHHRRLRAAADGDHLAGWLWTVGPRLVELAEVRAGEHVLDVGVGTGNAAVAAAEAGATVTGVDLAPELFRAAHGRADAAGVRVELVEGDPEDLPFGDDAFDAVLSAFGLAYSLRHAQVVSEIARVLAPSGTVAVAHWVADGAMSRIERLVTARLPMPNGAGRPGGWGDQVHVAEQFRAVGLETTFVEDVVTFEFDSPREFLQVLEADHGPTAYARRWTTEHDDWAPTRADLLALVTELNEAPFDGFRVDARYLVAVGRRT